LPALASRIYTLCDAKDGLKDGLITDPRRCDFKPARDLPVCAGADAPDCFTSAQIKTLETIYSDLVLNGKRIAPGWPVGAEITASNGRSGWDGWIVRDDGLSQSAQYADSALKFMVFPKPDPEYQMMRFNLERDAHLFDEPGKLISATDPNLAPFRDRGGKILMYIGWADPALNPVRGIEYYETVANRMGPSTRDFFRLYMLPGVFHCSGGVGPACFDPLAQVIPWVEQGKAPEAIVASQPEGGKTLRTRPLCPHPQVARYKGSGNPDDAANFTCGASL
jgi:feruloyl esterase